jgi:hypothetical protein
VTLIEKSKPSCEEEALESSLELKREVKVSNIDLEVIYTEVIVESQICPQGCTD